MTPETDLFGAPPAPAMPPGLTAGTDILSPEEERILLEALAPLPLAPFRFQGWLGKRETISFGWHYDFDAARFGRTDPIPEMLQPLRRRAAAFAGLAADDLVQLLVTRYDPGAGIGWHRDRPVFEHVIGISLGAPAMLRLRRRTDGGFARAVLPLPPRSVYHLAGVARHEWEHSIAALEQRRWSLTFRSLSFKGLAMA